MEASSAYTIANVLQAAQELRERGAIDQHALTALTAPLSRHDNLSGSVQTSASAQPASTPAPPSAAAPYASAPTPSTARAPAPPYSPAAASPAASEGRPSVAALKARLGGLTPPAGAPLPSTGAGAGARGVNGVPKRAPPPAPVKRAAPPVVEEKGERAKAKWDYAASADDELGFSKGDLLVVVERTTEDWWKGHRVGATGSETHDRLFPANYVELVKVPSLPPRRPTAMEKDPPPSYGVASSAPVAASAPPVAPVNLGPRFDYYSGAPMPSQPPPAYPLPAGAGGYGGYAAGAGGYGGYAAAPAAAGGYYAPDTSGTQGDSDAKMQARKAKFSKMANSNVGQAAAGGLAVGAAAGIIGSIF